MSPSQISVGAGTLPRPPGELLATFATVNDVHFGELECGHLDGLEELGPIYTSEPGAEPYPTLMNRCAVAEISAIDRMSRHRAAMARCSTVSLGDRSPSEVVETRASISSSVWAGLVRPPVMA